MANPTLPNLTESEANTLGSGGAHADTGIAYISKNTSKTDTPNLFTRLIQQIHHVLELLGGVNQGRVFPLTGLNVGVFELVYMIGSTEYNYAGDATFALTASETNHLYLDTAATLKNSTSGWPGGDHVKLAKIVAGATQVTSFEDSRLKNLQVGSISNWWTFLPQAAVGLNAQNLDNVGRVHFSGPDDKTIAAGIIGPDKTWTRVDTQDGDPSDDLSAITYLAGSYGHLLILSSKDAARVVTVTDGAIQLTNGDCVLDDPEKFLVLIGLDGGYTELFRSEISPRQLSVDLDCNLKALLNVGTFRFGAYETLVIAAGIVTKAQSYAKLLTQDSDGTDELDTISGGTAGDVLIVQARSGSQIPTVKHGTGNIQLTNERHFTLATTGHHLTLFFDGANWLEVSRSLSTVFDLAGTGKGLRWEPSHYVADTLTLNTTYDLRIYVPTETNIEKIAAYAVDAPSGGNCIVDLLDDGVSIFASQGDMAVIADGTNADQSATVDVTVAAGSYLTVKTHDVNAAGKLSVTIVGRRTVPSS